MRTSFIATLAFCLCFVTAVWADGDWRKGTLRLKSGKIFKDVPMKEDGDNWVIKYYGAEVPFKKADVLLAEFADQAKKKTEGAAAGAAQNSGNSGEYVDYLGRFILSAPKGWELKTPSNPGIRAAMRHKDPAKKAFMWVSVNALKGEFPTTKSGRAELKVVSERASAEYRGAFQTEAGGPSNIEFSKFFETEVLRLDYESNHPTWGKLSVIELRFALDGFEYTLRAGCDRAGFKSLQKELWRALESFSFVPEIEVGDRTFLDLKVGYALESPSDEWNFKADVFNSVSPVAIETEDKEARVNVEVINTTKSPADMISGEYRILRNRPGGECTELERWDGKRDGVDMVYRKVRGFAEKATTASQFFYFACRRGQEQVLMIKGVAPTSGANEQKYQLLMKRCFDSIRIFDVEVSKTKLAELAGASADYGTGLKLLKTRKPEEGLAKFDSALAKFPTFWAAVKGKALCLESLKRWEEFRKAAELYLDNVGDDTVFEKRVSGSFLAEAKEQQRRKDFESAMKNILRARRGDKDNKDINKTLYQIARGYSSKIIKDLDTKGAKELLRLHKSVFRKKNEDMKKLVLQTYLKLGSIYMKKGKFGDAKAMLRKAESIDRKDRGVTQLDTSIKRKIEQNKKRK